MRQTDRQTDRQIERERERERERRRENKNTAQCILFFLFLFLLKSALDAVGVARMCVFSNIHIFTFACARVYICILFSFFSSSNQPSTLSEWRAGVTLLILFETSRCVGDIVCMMMM